MLLFENNKTFLDTHVKTLLEYKLAKNFGRPDHQIHTNLSKRIFRYLKQKLAKTKGVLETQDFLLQIQILISFGLAQPGFLI